MILINPVHKVTNSVVSTDYAINLAFANMLYTAITERGEECMLPLTDGEYVTDTAYAKILTNNSFDIVFNIKCLHDVGSSVSGFSIETDSYTSLVYTIASEFVKWGSTSIYPLNYNYTPATSFNAQEDFAEITIGLGFVTNESDLSNLQSTTKLQELVDRIVSASYSPAIRSTQLTDDIGIPDPYFEIDTSVETDDVAVTMGWCEKVDTRIAGDVSKMVSSTIKDVPMRMLHVATASTARDYPLTWTTEVESAFLGYSCKAMLSYRMHNTSSTFSVLAAGETHEYAYDTSVWTTVSFDMTPDSDNNAFSMFFPAGCDVDVAAVWIMYSGVFGGLDDPLTSYSLYAPEYQPITSVDLTSIAAYNGSVSVASSLISKSKELMTEATSTLTSALSKIDQVSISATSLTDTVGAVLTTLSAATNVYTDLSSKKLSTDSSIMLASLPYVLRSDKKAALLNVINTVNGFTAAKASASETDEAKAANATVKAARLRALTIAKGEALAT